MRESDGENEIVQWLENHGTLDKDCTAGTPPRRTGPKGAFRVVRRKLRKTVDLHGMTGVRATAVLRSAFTECRRKNVDSLLVIHGIGTNSDPQTGPVLKRLVHDMLTNEFRSQVRDFRTALPADGDEGATLVKLK